MSCHAFEKTICQLHQRTASYKTKSLTQQKKTVSRGFSAEFPAETYSSRSIFCIFSSFFFGIPIVKVQFAECSGYKRNAAWSCNVYKTALKTVDMYIKKIATYCGFSFVLPRFQHLFTRDTHSDAPRFSEQQLSATVSCHRHVARRMRTKAAK